MLREKLKPKYAVEMCQNNDNRTKLCHVISLTLGNQYRHRDLHREQTNSWILCVYSKRCGRDKKKNKKTTTYFKLHLSHCVTCYNVLVSCTQSATGWTPGGTLAQRAITQCQYEEQERLCLGHPKVHGTIVEGSLGRREWWWCTVGSAGILAKFSLPIYI